jgi:hypothetical protein
VSLRQGIRAVLPDGMLSNYLRDWLRKLEARVVANTLPEGTEGQTLRYNGTVLEANDFLQVTDAGYVGVGGDPLAPLHVFGGIVYTSDDSVVPRYAMGYDATPVAGTEIGRWQSNALDADDVLNSAAKMAFFAEDDWTSTNNATRIEWWASDAAGGFSKRLELSSVGDILPVGSYQEGEYTVTGTTPDLDPSNGQMQGWTLTANSTPTVTSFEDGESLTLHILDGASYEVTWPAGIRWIDGTEPALDASEYTIVVLWKYNGIVFGNAAGAASTA